MYRLEFVLSMLIHVHVGTVYILYESMQVL